MKGLKKFLICAGVGLASLGIFSTQNVYAQANPSDSTTQTKTGTASTQLQEWGETLESILAMLYAIMWPLISIAGTAMNNDIVYGKIFGMDAVLFDYWTIIKNLANMIIGFLFVGGILMYMFNNKKGDWKKNIPGFLMAVIGIQASRFIMMALVDIGTITTFAIGGLPLSVSDANQVNDNYRMYNSIQLPLETQGNAVSNLTVYAIFPNPGDSPSPATGLVMPCVSTGGNGRLNPKNVELWKNYTSPVEKALEKNIAPVINIANPNQEVVFFKGTTQGDGNTESASKKLADRYAGALGEGKKPEKIDITTNKISTTYCIAGGTRLVEFKADELNFEVKQVGGVSIKEYIERLPATQKASGPLYTMYTNILSMSGLGDLASGAKTENFILVVILKAVVGLALIIPMAVLAIVMVMRVALLWIIISFSPFVIMGLALGWEKSFGGKIWQGDKFFNLGSILGLIFLPAVVSFALSIGVLFMSSLFTFWKSGSPESVGAKVNGNEFNQIFNVKTQENNGETYIQFGNYHLQIVKGDENPLLGVTSIFSFLIIGLLGAAIMWQILFLALKSSKFTSNMAQSIQGLGEGFLKTMPIVPTPGGGFVGTAAAGKVFDEFASTRNPWLQKRMREQNDRVGNFVGELDGSNAKQRKSVGADIGQALSSGQGIYTAASTDGKQQASVDANKFYSTLSSKVSGGNNNIEDYIDSDENVKKAWKENLNKLWDQSGATGDKGSTFAQMMDNAVFASYMMASTGKTKEQILGDFYKKGNIKSTPLKFDGLTDSFKPVGDKKIRVTSDGIIVAQKVGDGDNETVKISLLTKEDLKNSEKIKQELGEYNLSGTGLDITPLGDGFSIKDGKIVYTANQSADIQSVKDSLTDAVYKVEEGKPASGILAGIIQSAGISDNDKNALNKSLSDIKNGDISSVKQAGTNIKNILNNTNYKNLFNDPNKISGQSARAYLLDLVSRIETIPVPNQSGINPNQSGGEAVV